MYISLLIFVQNGGVYMVQNNHMSYGESKKRLESIFDAGTFVELGAYTKRNADVKGCFKNIKIY